MPVPLNSEPILDFSGDIFLDNEVLLRYKSDMVLDEAVNFYLREMERLGWRNVATFNSFESLLNFVKPGRFCTVSVRPLYKKSRIARDLINIFIFTGPGPAA